MTLGVVDVVVRGLGCGAGGVKMVGWLNVRAGLCCEVCGLDSACGAGDGKD